MSREIELIRRDVEFYLLGGNLLSVYILFDYTRANISSEKEGISSRETRFYPAGIGEKSHSQKSGAVFAMFFYFLAA